MVINSELDNSNDPCIFDSIVTSLVMLISLFLAKMLIYRLSDISVFSRVLSYQVIAFYL